MKNSAFLFYGLTVVTVLIFVACSERETQISLSDNEERELAEVSSLQDAVLDVEMLTFDAVIGEDENGRVAEGCVSVTRDQEARTITLDFGSGCTGPFGNHRAGKVLITYGGSFGDNLANRIVVFEDYSVNNRKISGRIELRDFNLDEAGRITHKRRHIDLTTTFPDGTYFTSNGEIGITWVSGFCDRDLTNNIFEISGSTEGISSRGRKVTREITKPLRIETSCSKEGGYSVVAGQVRISIEGMNRDRTRLVDYGDGTCDNTIVVTVNGKVHSISIGQ